MLLSWSPALQGLGEEEEEPECSPEHRCISGREDAGWQPWEVFRLSHVEAHGGTGEGKGPSPPQPLGQEAVEPRNLLGSAESLCQGSACLC